MIVMMMIIKTIILVVMDYDVNDVSCKVGAVTDSGHDNITVDIGEEDVNNVNIIGNNDDDISNEW